MDKYKDYDKLTNESYIEEGFFKKKSDKYTVIQYKVEPKKELVKIKSLFNKYRSKYKNLPSFVKCEPEKFNSDKIYNNFINGEGKAIMLSQFDQHDYSVISDFVKDINNEISKDGYSLKFLSNAFAGQISVYKYAKILNESYTPYKGRISTNKINFMANIARMNGIETTNRLRDDIVSEYTDILESLDTIDESIIVKDISLLPVYKIEDINMNESYIEEGFKDNEKYYYSQIIRTSKKIISSKLKDLKSYIKYDNIGSYKNKLETSNKNMIHSYVYAYIYNKDIKDKTLISEYIKNMNSELSPKGISITKSQFEHEKGGRGVEFSFKVKSRINEESLDNFFIEEETEIINESLSGDYQNIMSFNIGFLGRKIYSIKMLKRMKGSLEKKLNKYEIKLKEFKKMNDDEKAKFCFKINAGNAARSAAIAAGTTAVSQYASDGNYSLTYIELPDKITPYNYPGIAEKMIRKLKSDIQNIDKLIKQKEKAKGIKEGYAIDLDSLKYVVEYKKLTLEEAVQEIKDVNYIGDTYPMYCVIPEDINENMTLESFIDLNKSLINSNIIPMAINELSRKEWDRSNG